MIQIFLADGTDGTDGTDGPTEGSTRGPRGPKKDSKNEIHSLVIDLGNPSKGRSNTARHETITKGKPGRIVLEKVRWDYLDKKQKGGGKGGATATVIQFPVRLAWAITLHKIQVKK